MNCARLHENIKYNNLDLLSNGAPPTRALRARVELRYDQPTGPTDAVPMQHNVDYSVCGDNRKCKNKADRKMVQSLDAIPYNERQWGHWLARNLINTKQKLGLGLN